MGSMLSGLLGGGQSDAQAGQTAALQRAADSTQAYRPEAMQARMNLLNKVTGAYQGMNNALETMYGGRSPTKVGGGFASHTPENPHGLPAQNPNATFGGNQLPQQQPMPQQPQGRPMSQGSGFNPLDPLGIFGGR